MFSFCKNIVSQQKCFSDVHKCLFSSFYLYHTCRIPFAPVSVLQDDKKKIKIHTRYICCLNIIVTAFIYIAVFGQL